MEVSIKLTILPPIVGRTGLSPFAGGFLVHKVRNKLAQCACLFRADLFPRICVSRAGAFAFAEPSKLFPQFTRKVRLFYPYMFLQERQYLSLSPDFELEWEGRLLVAVEPLQKVGRRVFRQKQDPPPTGPRVA